MIFLRSLVGLRYRKKSVNKTSFSLIMQLIAIEWLKDKFARKENKRVFFKVYLINSFLIK